MIDLSAPLDLRSKDAIQLLADIQGNILKSHGRTYATHLLLRFKLRFPNTARAWLKHFAETKVTSAYEQLNQTLRHKAGWGYDELFAMVVLSAEGYRVLDFRPSQLPNNGDEIFAEGMANRREILHDDCQADLAEPYNDNFHAMVLLAHADQDQLYLEVEAVQKQLVRFCDTIHVESGKVLRNTAGLVVEHFGYADGISQPVFITDDIEKEKAERGSKFWDPAAGLDLVLVEEAAGAGTYGSFMVYRKLQQHVDRFNTAVAQLAEALGVSQAEAGAYLVGRRQDGTPLLEADQPARGFANDFSFAGDEAGLGCPFHAHVRKTNPRREQTKAFRIARRGIPYGERSGSDSGYDFAPPDDEVGLLFMSFQANLENFERLQIWANDKDFASEGVGVDALIGRDPAESPQKWSTESSEAELCIANLVTLKGGEYFFAPSLPFLKSLEVEPFTDDHQTRFGDASAQVVASLDALAPVGELWPEDRMAAVKSLGIRPADFDAYYALLMPYLFDLNYSYTTEPDTGMAPTEPDVYALAQAAVPPVEVRERVRQAFLKLLDLQTLQRFSERYREDPVAALAMIGLSQQDSDQFYAYLQENYSMDFRFLAWG